MEQDKMIRTKISSKDVARLAGVSQSTVSRAYSDTYQLDPELKKKVFDAAKELGYHPNAIARSLLSNRSNIIGIVTSTLDSPFYSAALQSFAAKLQKHGLQSLVFVVERSEDLDMVVDHVLSYRVDLILIFGAQSTTKAAGICTAHGTPTVLFNRYIPQSRTSAVCCNDYQCGQMVARELYKSGCRRFAYISGFENVTTNIDRKDGFMHGLRELGIPDCQVIAGGYSYDAGLLAGQALAERHPDVDACFCANDITAIGVLDYIRYRTDKSVPEELSIVGFDDIAMSRQLSYQLSTVRQPIEQMVDASISTILDILGDSSMRPMVKIIEGEYISRKTTK